MADQKQNVYFSGASVDVNAVRSEMKPPAWAQVFSTNAALEVCALVDNGAAVTIIHSDTFRKLRTIDNRLQRAKRPILGANSKPLDVCSTTTLEIHLGGIKQRHEV